MPETKVTGIGLELAAIAVSFKSLFHRKGGSEYNLLLLEKASSTTKVAWFGALSDPFLLIELGLDKHLMTIIRGLDLNRLLNL